MPQFLAKIGTHDVTCCIGEYVNLIYAIYTDNDR